MPDIEKSSLNMIVPGTGCCTGEILAARGPIYDMQRFGINIVSIPEDADILVLSGPVGKDMADRFFDIYSRMPAPRWVFAAGTCAVSGGRFCGSYRLMEEIKRKLHIDMYIPGCPPRPEAFLYSALRFISDNMATTFTGRKNV